MKKILLSIFAVLFAFAGVQAEEVTKSVTFSDYTAGTQYAENEEHDLGDGLVIYTTQCHFTTQLRIYSSSTHDGYVVSDALPGTITKMTFNAGNKVDNIVIYGSNDGSAWTQVGVVAVTSTSYNDYDFNFTGSYTRFKLDVEGANQIRIAKMSVTYTTSGEGGGETPVIPTAEKPVFNPESREFNLGESVTVEISAAEGATIYYTTDGETPTENSDVYENALTITETTTVKAIAVIEGYNNSAVAEATYTAVDPNAVTETIVASEAGIANGIEVETLKFGNVTATFDKGSNSNATKYYSSGTAFRAYGGNTITFTGDAGVTINSVVFTFGTNDGSNEITVDCGTYSDGTWTGASNEVVFAIGGTSGNRRLAKIAVTYSVEEGVVVIATPSIAGEATFVGSTTVEITNNAEGTTLYYSTNGVDYVAYTDVLNIAETTTVYAKAVDAQGNESAAAEATFTKLETLTIAEAKAAYDAAGANVDIAMDLAGAVVTVNSGLYMFIENETTGINIYNSGADYAVGTKFTSGYILGTSAVYGKMHQITNAEFNNVETTTIEVVPTEVAVADLNANFDTYEGRFVRLTGADINGNNIAQGENAFGLYNRFDFITAPTSATGCDIEGIVARYNATLQIYPVSISNTINVTEAGFATLYLAYPVVIPADVKAYTVTEVGAGYVTLTQVTGVLPANTGVIVEADKGSYDFVYSADEATAVTDNKLLGSAVNTYVNGDAYVLGNVNGIGLYKAVLNKDADGAEGTTHFLNNANKAYLPASVASGAASYSFRFGDGTTGIDQITENRVQSTAIYDLTGRCVEAISAPGIYIVNGKKVLVK